MYFSNLVILKRYQCFFSRSFRCKNIAPKRHTRSNPSPNPPPGVDDPEKLLRKLKTTLPKSGTQKLVRTTSLPDQLFIVEDLSFDILFELSLIWSKFESFLSEVVFYPIKFDSYLPSSKSLFSRPFAKSMFSKLDDKVWSNFDNLQIDLPLNECKTLSSCSRREFWRHPLLSFTT